jgi:hypothetical protein
MTGVPVRDHYRGRKCRRRKKGNGGRIHLRFGLFQAELSGPHPDGQNSGGAVNERILGLNSVDIGNIDYSFKSVKPILHDEAKIMEIAQSQAVIPVLYGGMPDLGRYTKPDGPVENWSELMPLGKVEEARAAQEEAVELAVKDLVYIADGMAAGRRRDQPGYLRSIRGCGFSCSFKGYRNH